MAEFSPSELDEIEDHLARLGQSSESETLDLSASNPRINQRLREYDEIARDARLAMPPVEASTAVLSAIMDAGREACASSDTHKERRESTQPLVAVEANEKDDDSGSPRSRGLLWYFTVALAGAAAVSLSWVGWRTLGSDLSATENKLASRTEAPAQGAAASARRAMGRPARRHASTVRLGRVVDSPPAAPPAAAPPRPTAKPDLVADATMQEESPGELDDDTAQLVMPLPPSKGSGARGVSKSRRSQGRARKAKPSFVTGSGYRGPLTEGTTIEEHHGGTRPSAPAPGSPSAGSARADSSADESPKPRTKVGSAIAKKRKNAQQTTGSTSNNRVALLLVQADRARDTGKCDSALGLYRRVLREARSQTRGQDGKNRTLAKARLGQGICYLRAGRHSLAEEEFARARTLWPSIAEEIERVRQQFRN